MTTHHMKLAWLVAIALVTGAAAAHAQGQPLTALRVQVVISKYQGDKKISSLPYTLSVNANDSNRSASLRMGAQVPIVSTAAGAADGKPVTSVQYKDVGTSIDCSVNSIDESRFRLNITIEDSSVYTDDRSAQGAPIRSDHPAFRSFRSIDMLILKDGQSAQYTSGTDKVSGEVVKIDVTLTVLK